MGWGYVQAVDRCLLSAQAVETIKALSREWPLLFFVTADEFMCVDPDSDEPSDLDGWGFRLFDQGEERAQVMFDYGWPTYGAELEAQLRTVLTGFDPAVFSLFAPGETRERQLAQLLTPDSLFARLEADGTLEDVEREFARVLDIEFDFLVAG